MGERCLVVTEREVIAMDLVEYLTAHGGRVDLLRALHCAALGEYGLAVIDEGQTHGPDDPRLETLRRKGARVIVFHTGHDRRYADHALIPLHMPFTSRDLDRLFAKYDIKLRR